MLLGFQGSPVEVFWGFGEKGILSLLPRSTK